MENSNFGQKVEKFTVFGNRFLASHKPIQNLEVDVFFPKIL